MKVRRLNRDETAYWFDSETERKRKNRLIDQWAINRIVLEWDEMRRRLELIVDATGGYETSVGDNVGYNEAQESAP